MRQAVLDNFRKFTDPLEGTVDFMYLDQHRDAAGNLAPLVTTGIGNLIDPIPAALRLRWSVRRRTNYANTLEIMNAWTTVKKRVDLALHGGMAYKGLTNLYLEPAELDRLFLSRLNANEAILKGRFKGWDTFPADAQMGIHSMAWAMGANFNFPKFQTACGKLDWVTAANECKISNGAKARNDANKALFLAAATTPDPETLHWP